MRKVWLWLRVIGFLLAVGTGINLLSQSPRCHWMAYAIFALAAAVAYLELRKLRR